MYAAGGNGDGADCLIDLRRVGLRRNGREILRDIDWRVRRGEHWAVIGANGSGKTTLLQIAGAVLFPSSGEATVLGGRFGAADLFKLRRRVGWVASALTARLPGGETARDIVISGLKATFGLVYEYSEADRLKADETLRRLGLADRADAPFGVLSQGEQQKTLFARALMAGPELLILDEACSGLDLSAREAFLRAVGGVAARREAGLILVTHHIEEIPAAVTHALILGAGRVLASGRVDAVLTPEILSPAFGLDVRIERRGGRFWTRVEGRPLAGPRQDKAQGGRMG
ncbi:MAG: ABC transporter ATP-binding protein [Planctomycetota bacterium]|jgi:iron complex transport system ATP-binding protein|nr:ABC transporter ATP-binding protein [Planctomycetota bacterium]